MVLYVTRGLPGSGKSRWAKTWVAQNPEQRVRVNRDSLRDMLWGGAYTRDTKFEDVVVAAQRAQVWALLASGLDVVCDDTNLDPAVMERWTQLATQAAAQLVVIDLTLVPVETCVERDATRPMPGKLDGSQVGEVVIRDMAARYL